MNETPVKRKRGRPRKNPLGPKNVSAVETFGPDFVELVKRYQATGKVEYPVLNKAAERELIESLRDKPDELKKRLVLHNIKMVFDMAKKYVGKTNDFNDMVARGMYGLSLAAEKFDIDKNIKFSTYCYAWIFKYVVKEFYDKEFQVTSKSLSMDVSPGDLSGTVDDSNRSFDNLLTETAIEPTCNYSSLDCASLPDNKEKNNLEKMKNLTAEISNYVKTSADFTPKDQVIYDRVMLGSEPIKDVAKTEKLTPSFITSRIAYITDTIKKMLKAAYDVDDMAGIYAL